MIYQADLAAYSYMENQGKGDKYIESLMFLGTDYDNLHPITASYPTTTERINFLNYVKANPQIFNKENGLLRFERVKRGQDRFPPALSLDYTPKTK